MQQSFLGPSSLFVLAVIAGSVAVLLVLWLLGRGLGGLVDRPRVPRPGTTYVAFSVLVLVLGTLAATAYGLRGLYLDHANVGGPARLGELRCESLAGGRVRTSFTPTEVGARPEIAEEAASSCRVELSLIRMRGYPSTGPIGLGSLARVSAVGHQPRPGTGVPQLAPDRLPLSLLVRQLDRAEATTPPEANTVWNVTAIPAGAPGNATGPPIPIPAAGAAAAGAEGVGLQAAPKPVETGSVVLEKRS